MASAERLNAYNVLNKYWDFAKSYANDGDAIVKSANDQSFDGLLTRLVRNTDDRVRGILTWTAPGRNEEMNDAMRNYFRSALFRLYNINDANDLPPSVLKEFIASDYDCGKPLTARRIARVMRAVEADGKLDEFREDEESRRNLTAFVDGKLSLEEKSSSAIRKDLDELIGNIGKSAISGGGGLRDLIYSVAADVTNKPEDIYKDFTAFFTGVQRALESRKFNAALGGTVKNDSKNGLTLVCEKSNIISVPVTDGRFDMACENFLAQILDRMLERHRFVGRDGGILNAGEAKAALDQIVKTFRPALDRILIRKMAIDSTALIKGETLADSIRLFEEQVAAKRSESPDLPVVLLVGELIDELTAQNKIAEQPA